MGSGLDLTNSDAAKVLVAFAAGESMVPPASCGQQTGSRYVQLKEKQEEILKHCLNSVRNILIKQKNKCRV